MTRLALFLVLLAAAIGPAQARPGPASIPEPSAECRAAILHAERATGVPDRLLDAIAVVESGRRDPVSGAIYPWPWTINVEGVGHIYESKAEAIAAVREFQAQGARSIDVGCMQVNLMYHPDAFASLEQAFDPVTNANYGARFLQILYGQTNAWPRAVAAYHSATPELGDDYARKVLAAWGVPMPPVGSQTITQPAMAVAANAGMMSEGLRGGAGAFGGAGQGAAPTPAFGNTPARVAVMLPPGGAEPIRVMPLGAGGGGLPPGGGHGLDAYRASPVQLASRTPRGL